MKTDNGRRAAKEEIEGIEGRGKMMEAVQEYLSDVGYSRR